jgi:hypothetical protein
MHLSKAKLLTVEMVCAFFKETPQRLFIRRMYGNPLRHVFVFLRAIYPNLALHETP